MLMSLSDYVVMSCTELEFISRKQLKIGHGGTLDRLATGVLAVGLGTGCTLLKGLQSDKVNEVLIIEN